MDEFQNQRFENLVDNMMKDSTLESPSSGFTSKLMKEIATLAKSERLVYKPLLSKNVKYFLIVAFVLLLAGLVAMVDLESTLFTYPLRQMGYLGKLSDYLPSFEWSRTFVYAFVFMALMIFVQVSFLKRFFERRLI